MRGDAAPALPQAACGSSASGMIEHEERKRERLLMSACHVLPVHAVRPASF